VSNGEGKSTDRRSLLTIATRSMVAVGAGLAAIPLLSHLAPSRDQDRAKPIEIDFAELREGQWKFFFWRGNRHVIYRRSPEEIVRSKSVDMKKLVDRSARNSSLAEDVEASDANRCFGPEGRYCLMSFHCTHLGCVLLPDQPLADFHRPTVRFVCPCHTAKFDSAGRVLSAPAPTNLPIPKFRLLSETRLELGSGFDAWPPNA
jgi:ubiquinol-cytochrome c reductase iron-sulfur subunit